MSKAQMGVVGMAVMGKNLALNIESRGYTVAIYNRTTSRAEKVIEENPDKNLILTRTLEELVESLEVPRKILLLVKAGAPTDSMIDQLLPLLDEGDILIDGGNTYFKDTIKRSERIAKENINFIGMGTSGGEDGALHGPSLMPGGPKEAVDKVLPILEDIAAKAKDGEPCVVYIGPNGAGHYVKMVHNGIEYGDMELISEAYQLLHDYLGYTPEEIGTIFSKWNEGELDSYLIELTAEILTKHDPETGKPMVDVILDRAGSKGTGKWTAQEALDLGLPLSTITEAVFSRYMSSLKDKRVRASKVLSGPKVSKADLTEEEKEALVEKIRQALYFSKLMSYAQGFAQYYEASKVFDWNLNLKEIAKIFRAGCIIRSRFLGDIMTAYDKTPDLENILLDSFFKEIVNNYQESEREIVALAASHGIPVSGFMSALIYYDSYRSEVLPANIIQAQRDFFGAHTYERNDKEGVYHFLWEEEKELKMD